MHREELFHLLYVSHACNGVGKQEISEIVKVSHENNLELGITGILIYGKGRFMQFLEGSRENVKYVFLNIQIDTRHKNVYVLREGSIPQRQFRDWHMRYTSLSEIHMSKGIIYEKLFNLKNKTAELLEYAIESRTILLAFKNDCLQG